MKTSSLVHFQAVRGQRVIVDDVLVVVPSKARAARSEIARRARAVLSSFGKLPGDVVLELETIGQCVQH